MRADAARSSRGSTTTGLLLLLVLLVAAGGFNYYRNFQAEARIPRPYRSYTDAQLTALINAYRQEVKGLGAGASGGRLSAGATGQLLDERVAAYERLRKADDARRRGLERAAGDHSILDKLEQEQQLRKKLGSGLALHLHRLLSLSGG